jgi:hypothetical protein
MNDVTVVVPTSPIRSHPDTAIIDECIRTIRHHLPTSEIILTFDGIHPEQTHFTGDYLEYKTRMLWKCLHEYHNVLPIIFPEHEHQSGMMKKVMEEIHTPLILYVESDTMLSEDNPIDWDACREMLYEGIAHTIRFHFEAQIPKEHESLILDEPKHQGFVPTIQWSQRPHLSTKAYYEWMLTYFPEDSRTFIEDEWHGVVIRDYDVHGITGWFKHRLWIYHPKGNIKRSYTVDGRQGVPKVGEGFQK